MNSNDIHSARKPILILFHLVVLLVLCCAAISGDHLVLITANTTLQTLVILHFSKMN